MLSSELCVYFPGYPWRNLGDKILEKRIKNHKVALWAWSQSIQNWMILNAHHSRSWWNLMKELSLSHNGVNLCSDQNTPRFNLSYSSSDVLTLLFPFLHSVEHFPSTSTFLHTVEIDLHCLPLPAAQYSKERKT